MERATYPLSSYPDSLPQGLVRTLNNCSVFCPYQARFSGAKGTLFLLKLSLHTCGASASRILWGAPERVWFNGFPLTLLDLPNHPGIHLCLPTLGAIAPSYLLLAIYFGGEGHKVYTGMISVLSICAQHATLSSPSVGPEWSSSNLCSTIPLSLVPFFQEQLMLALFPSEGLVLTNLMWGQLLTDLTSFVSNHLSPIPS